MTEDDNKSLRCSLIELGCTHQLSRLPDRESHQLSSQPVAHPKPTFGSLRLSFLWWAKYPANVIHASSCCDKSLTRNEFPPYSASPATSLSSSIRADVVDCPHMWTPAPGQCSPLTSLPHIALVRTTFGAESHGHCRSRTGVRHTSGASCAQGVFAGWAAV
jgi:hypothetical protein